MEKLSPKIQVIPGKLRFSPVLLEHPISNHLQGQILFNHDLQKKHFVFSEEIFNKVLVLD